jgi:hypothetical protein
MRNFQRTNGREVLNFYKERVEIDLNIYRNGIAANLAAEMMMTRTPGDAKKTTKRKKEAIERAKICRKTIPKYVIKCMQNCRNRDSPLNTAIASKEHPFADILRAPRISSSRGTPSTPVQSTAISPNLPLRCGYSLAAATISLKRDAKTPSEYFIFEDVQSLYIPLLGCPITLHSPFSSIVHQVELV